MVDLSFPFKSELGLPWTSLIPCLLPISKFGLHCVPRPGEEEIKRETPSWMAALQILVFSNLPATTDFSESLNCSFMCSIQIFSCISGRLGRVCLLSLIWKWTSPEANIFNLALLFYHFNVFYKITENSQLCGYFLG